MPYKASYRAILLEHKGSREKKQSLGRISVVGEEGGNAYILALFLEFLLDLSLTHTCTTI